MLFTDHRPLTYDLYSKQTNICHKTPRLHFTSDIQYTSNVKKILYQTLSHTPIFSINMESLSYENIVEEQKTDFTLPSQERYFYCNLKVYPSLLDIQFSYVTLTKWLQHYVRKSSNTLTNYHILVTTKMVTDKIKSFDAGMHSISTQNCPLINSRDLIWILTLLVPSLLHIILVDSQLIFLF